MGKENRMKTIAVIGAGIVGSFLAYDLTQYEEVEVILFENMGMLHKKQVRRIVLLFMLDMIL